MSEFPSLIIFPSNSKSDSRKFPSDMPINSSNVLWFILANLTPSQRLQGLLKICNYKVYRKVAKVQVKIYLLNVFSLVADEFNK